MTTDPITDAAADWYVRLHAPDAGRHQAAFDRWRAADPEHAREYDRIVDIAALAGRTVHRPSPAARDLRRKPRWMLVGGGSAAAAAAAIAIALVVLPNLSVRSGATLIAQASASPSTFRLEDGTTVVLDRGGRARVAMRPDARHVILEAGHAVFAVADDATRPFVVDAASRRIVARSRRFEVGIEDGTAQIVPLDGRLEVGGQGKGLALDAPRMLVPAFHVPPIDMSMGDASSASATADDGRVTFEDQTLAEVALAANRFEGPALRFVGAVATRRVTGVFDIRNHAALARKLASAFNLQVETSAREIVLRQK